MTLAEGMNTKQPTRGNCAIQLCTGRCYPCKGVPAPQAHGGEGQLNRNEKKGHLARAVNEEGFAGYSYLALTFVKLGLSRSASLASHHVGHSRTSI